MLKAHLLDTLDDVIGPIEKIVEALEKSFTSKFTFFRFDVELEISGNVNFEVKLFFKCF